MVGDRIGIVGTCRKGLPDGITGLGQHLAVVDLEFEVFEKVLLKGRRWRRKDRIAREEADLVDAEARAQIEHEQGAQHVPPLALEGPAAGIGRHDLLEDVLQLGLGEVENGWGANATAALGDFSGEVLALLHAAGQNAAGKVRAGKIDEIDRCDADFGDVGIQRGAVLRLDGLHRSPGLHVPLPANLAVLTDEQYLTPL